ncbi:MAG: catechol 2,3-dioxygenase [Paracoccaceae bacterium]|jgi:catechol 2,3-dioxygenase
MSEVAHLGHVEVYTDKFDESLGFFIRVYGLTENGHDENSAYLRPWDDYEFHTLKLTRNHTTGVGHIGYRVSSPEALDRRVAAIQGGGYGGEWVASDMGHGRAYRFSDPFGHVFELYWDTVKYVAPEGEKPAFKNLAQRYHGRGACPRRLDHLNLLSKDVSVFRDFMITCLGTPVELANANALLVLAPDWETVVWTEDDRKKGQAWGLKPIETYHTHGTPPVQKQAGLCQVL